LDIYRKYDYAVNPDPTNYFKTPHVNIFFKQKYSGIVELSFDKIEEYLESYLPINMVIDFFGYKSELDDEEFYFRTESFKVDSLKLDVITFAESKTYPTELYAYGVWSPTPANYVDIYGTPCDGYSYAGYIENGNNIFGVMPKP
jgi:hypothetical protein